MRGTTQGADPTGRLRFTTEGLAWLCVAAALGLVGWVKSLNALLLLAYAMAGLLVVNGALAWLHVRRVRAARVGVPPVFAGEWVRLAVRVANVSGRPAGVGVRDRDEWYVGALPSGAEVECVGEDYFPARGRVRGGAPVVWSAFPFGFLCCDRAGEPGGELVVLPALGTVDPEAMRRWLMRQAGAEGRARKVLRRVTSDQADVRGVRPYRPGDSIRTVHWRSSARHGEMMVREYDAAPSPDLVLVVEPWLSANPSGVERARLENALSLAASVAWHWSRAFGSRVTLVVAEKEPVVRSVPAQEGAAREALAPLADVVGSPTPGAVTPAAFDRSLAQATRVIVSSRAAGPLAAALAQATGRPFVAIDPMMRLPWYQPPDDSE